MNVFEFLLACSFFQWLGVLALTFLVTLIVVTLLLDVMSMFQRRK